jgi:hypothetical protein
MRTILCCVLLLPACTSQIVRCDGILRPINAPAPSGQPIAGAAAIPHGKSP